MLDINKLVSSENSGEDDPNGNLFDLDPWSEEIATEHAAKEGIALSDEHWEIIRFLRGNYAKHGIAPSGRVLLKALEEQFGKDGNTRHLFQLFPHGPVNQGCRIAGLPLPPHSSDPAFGYVE